MQQWSTIARRIARLGMVLLCVVVLTFSMVHLIPGDPARTIAGAQADQSAVDIVRTEFGLDRPLFEQFMTYLFGIVQGDFGTSFKTRQPVADIIAQKLEPTLTLTLAAVVLIAVSGVLIGLLSGIISHRQRPGFDVVFSGVTGALAAMPHYLTATFLVFLFAVTWKWFPVAGADGFSALVLPAIAVSLRPSMMVARVIRVRTLEVLEQSYVRTAWSKRTRSSQVYLRHVLPNAAPAGLALGGTLFASLIGGAVVVEIVFARPGLGTELIRSVISGDYPVVQGITLVLGASVVLMNMFVDVLIGVFDPQAKEA
ncbi:ABC transporter permease [Leucobacter chinensis]|uniref:ABC transporter permease n=1 Tax=Leucobacter chinensis TaxID=2851010 RepID=UPI001C22DB55|nr:ABC transporter permease [Leucobacter chinensis]